MENTDGTTSAKHKKMKSFINRNTTRSEMTQRSSYLPVYPMSWSCSVNVEPNAVSIGSLVTHSDGMSDGMSLSDSLPPSLAPASLKTISSGENN